MADAENLSTDNAGNDAEVATREVTCNADWLGAGFSLLVIAGLAAFVVGLRMDGFRKIIVISPIAAGVLSIVFSFKPTRLLSAGVILLSCAAAGFAAANAAGLFEFGQRPARVALAAFAIAALAIIGGLFVIFGSRRLLPAKKDI